MNRLSIFIVAVLGLHVAVSTASADTIQSFTVGVSTKKQDSAAKLTLTQQSVDTGNIRPFNVARASWFLPAGSKIDVRAARFCSVRQLQASGVCPTGSKLGTGSVKLSLFAGAHTEVEGEVVAYNAKRTKSGSGNVGRLVLQVISPVIGLQSPLVGHITKTTTAPFGYQIRFDNMALPEVEGVVPTMALLQFDLEAKKKKRTKSSTRTFNYFTTPARCSGRWFFRGDFRMQNKLLLSASDDVSCSRRNSNS